MATPSLRLRLSGASLPTPNPASRAGVIQAARTNVRTPFEAFLASVDTGTQPPNSILPQATSLVKAARAQPVLKPATATLQAMFDPQLWQAMRKAALTKATTGRINLGQNFAAQKTGANRARRERLGGSR